MDQTMKFPHMRQVKIASGLDIFVAALLFITALNAPTTRGLAWSNGISAVIIGVFAGLRVAGAYRQTWLSWTNAAIAGWVIFSPWLVGGVDQRGLTNNVILGTIILFLACWSAMATHTDPNFGDIDSGESSL